MAKKKELTYKEASEELERIVSEIESGEIDLDVLAEKVKRASYLINACREKLRSTEKKVEEVLTDMAAPKKEEPDSEEASFSEGSALF